MNAKDYYIGLEKRPKFTRLTGTGICDHLKNVFDFVEQYAEAKIQERLNQIKQVDEVFQEEPYGYEITYPSNNSQFVRTLPRKIEDYEKHGAKVIILYAKSQLSKKVREDYFDAGVDFIEAINDKLKEDK